jgi:hypothetical protein
VTGPDPIPFADNGHLRLLAKQETSPLDHKVNFALMIVSSDQNISQHSEILLVLLDIFLSWLVSTSLLLFARLPVPGEPLHFLGRRMAELPQHLPQPVGRNFPLLDREELARLL